MKRKLKLFFTRDFNQWTLEISRLLYMTAIPKLWGRGLEDQLIHYTGRAFEWLRYEDDYNALTEYMVRRDQSGPLFSQKVFDDFLRDVDSIRRLIHPKNKVRNIASYYEEIKSCCFRFYPMYAFCVFYPGPWREQVIRIHGEKAKNVLDRYLEGRRRSEGVLKENDLFFRSWLGPKMQEMGHNPQHMKLLSLQEFDDFVYRQILPDKQVLEERSMGFVFINGVIHPTKRHKEFLLDRGILYPEDEKDISNNTLHGTVACVGGIIEGSVQIIMNEQEAARFQEGSILISSMTSPEYLRAMRKSRAIVTDEGGVTCHAAIVSRELGVPCIIGTKSATKKLQDGDRVRVDTINGIITKL